MTPRKSPGIDILHAKIFQQHWDIVGLSFFSMIQSVFNGGDLDPYFNQASPVLILKHRNPEMFVDFHPIILCFVLCKLITKTIVQRLQPIMSNIIAPAKTSFIKD
ncbi:hypothetical protein V6N12_057082 [Hibiscus sabdariffa]|uniref:Reverse transcriptase domain-containing protein n=1 Tax=Hibiscus sabdariffa TaxID=183260 RepID=A0ABR2DFV5_9ROSI